MATPFLPTGSLHPSQDQAIANIRSKAISLRPIILPTLNQILKMGNLPTTSLTSALSSISQHARIALHFHPDRLFGSIAVSSSLLHSGIYKSQFETLISAGSVTAYAGGARDEWERSLFAGAYQSHGVSASHRPKYGALDIVRNDDGPAPRFGSCFFILKPKVSTRSTFTFGGSEAGPRYVGTIDEFHAILSALLEEAFVRDFCLGVHEIRPVEVMKKISELGNAVGYGGDREPSRNLDHFIEAQVHGDVLLGRDVEALVVDSSFKGTETERDLEAMAEKYGFELRWRKGFRIRVEDIPMDFRGATMPSLAKAVARDGAVDAAAIGRGVWDLAKNPKGWSERENDMEVLQELKLLWHVLVRFGKA